MSSITKLFRGFICIVLILAFMTAGPFMSFLSGLIESTVFAEIFKTDIVDEKVITIFSIGIAIIFEIVKNFSNAILPLISITSSDNRLISFGKMTKKARILLIAISFVCTLIFTGNALTKTSTSENEKTTLLEELSDKYDSDEKEIYDSLDKDYKSQLDLLFDTMTEDRNTMNAHLQSNQFNEETYEILRNNYSNSKKEYDNFLKNGYNQTRKSKGYDKKLDELSKNYQKNKQAIENEDNVYLQQSTYLSNFINILGIDSTDSDNYIFTVIVLSVTISILTEVIINISASFLSTNANYIFNKFEEQVRLTTEELKKLHKVFKSLRNAAICLAIYIVFMILQNEPIITNALIVSFSAFIISNLSFNHKNENEFNELPLFNKLQDLIINGLIAFVFYFVFGIFCGNKFTDMSSLAVTIGAIIGQYLNLNPNIKFFSKK